RAARVPRRARVGPRVLPAAPVVGPVRDGDRAVGRAVRDGGVLRRRGGRGVGAGAGPVLVGGPPGPAGRGVRGPVRRGRAGAQRGPVRRVPGGAARVLPGGLPARACRVAGRGG